MCSNNWDFEGNGAQITIYEFSVTSAHVEFDRIYHNATLVTYEDLTLSGQVQIQDFIAQVFYNQSQPIFMANISYTSDVLSLELTDLVYTPLNCSIEEQIGA